METTKLSSGQLFVLVVLFEMGSAILFGLGTNAKQDAWMSIILGMLGGFAIFQIYHRLFTFYPDIPLTGYLQKIIGKWAGKFLGLLYVVYFIYIASRVLRDFGELLTSTIYFQTPLFIINSLMIITIIYALTKGIEVLARVGELFFIVVYLMALGGVILIVASGMIHVDELQPMLEKGLMPVIKTTLGETLLFPFGEMIVFTMILPLLNEPKKAKKVCLWGIFLSGINITITTMINICSLGIELYARSPFPLLSTIQRISLLHFIERLDVLFMIYLIIGGFIKIGLFYYAAVAGAADIFKFSDIKKIIFPIGLIILFASLEIASNFAEHAKEGLVVVPIYLHWPFQIIIPSILLIIALFRNRKKKPQAQQVL